MNGTTLKPERIFKIRVPYDRYKENIMRYSKLELFQDTYALSYERILLVMYVQLNTFPHFCTELFS